MNERDIYKINTNTKILMTFDCKDDSCQEPTKRLAGFGTGIKPTYIPQLGRYVMMRHHINTYNCDNLDCPKRSSCIKV